MKKPNILVFMADHYRWDMAPPYQRAITPNLDKIAEKGLTFDHAYCPSPHCCPSRASFFTGLYPSEHGVWNNVGVGNTLSRGLYDHKKLFSDYLLKEGYDLYYSGKWHVSALESPHDRGYKGSFITSDKSDMLVQHGNSGPLIYEWDYYKKSVLNNDTVLNQRKAAHIVRPGYPDYIQYFISERPFNDDNAVEAGMKIIKERKKDDKPWFQFVGTEGPHDPYNVPQRFLDMFPLEKIELPESFDDDMLDKPNLYRRTKSYFSQLSRQEQKISLQYYLAFCTYEDNLFGKIVDALAVSGELENTLLIFTSDHGDYAGEHGLWAKGLPCFNSAYRVPVVMYWKDGIINPGRTVSDFVTLSDFAPTFCEVAGVTAKAEFSGQSLMPFMKDEKPEQWRDAVFSQSNGNEQYGIQRSVMTKKYKYVYNGFDFDELYDLEKDPLQMKNIINDSENQSVVRELCKRMWKFAYKHKDVCINPYIMVGFAPYGPGLAFEEDML